MYFKLYSFRHRCLFHTDFLYTESPRRGLVLVFRTRSKFVVGADIIFLEVLRRSAIDCRVQGLELLQHHVSPCFVTTVVTL